MARIAVVIGVVSIFSVGSPVTLGDSHCYAPTSVAVAEVDGETTGLTVAMGGGWHAIGNTEYNDGDGLVVIAKFDAGAWTEYQGIGPVAGQTYFGRYMTVGADLLAIWSKGFVNSVELFTISEATGVWTWAGLVNTVDNRGSLPGAMAISGDTFVVAERDSTGSVLVQVWVQNGDDAWNRLSWWDTGVNSEVSLDFDGQTIVVGLPGYDSGLADDVGAVKMYTFVEGGSWQLLTTHIPYEDEADAQVGQRVAVDGVFMVYTLGGSDTVGGISQFDLAKFGSAGAFVVEEVVGGESIRGIDIDGTAVVVSYNNEKSATFPLHLYAIGDHGLSEEQSLEFEGEVSDSPNFSVAIDGTYLIAEGIGTGSTQQIWIVGIDDCDNNGYSDSCEVLDLPGGDQDGDAVLDRCDCPGNVNAHVDATVDSADVFGVINLFWGGGDGWPAGSGDCNGDGRCNIEDLIIVLRNWGDCPS